MCAVITCSTLQLSLARLCCRLDASAAMIRDRTVGLVSVVAPQFTLLISLLTETCEFGRIRPIVPLARLLKFPLVWLWRPEGLCGIAQMERTLYSFGSVVNLPVSMEINSSAVGCLFRRLRRIGNDLH